MNQEVYEILRELGKNFDYMQKAFEKGMNFQAFETDDMRIEVKLIKKRCTRCHSVNNGEIKDGICEICKSDLYD